MAAGIVHELNQPIAAIRTHAASGRLLLERKETEKVQETLAAVARMTEHMASITAQLKTFAHQTPKLKEQVLLQDCLDEALAMVAPLFNEFGISLHKDVPEDPLILSGGRGRIKQVLVNLLRNAVDAMQNCSQRDLWVVISVDQQDVEISISDSGSGIAEQDLDELFTPFFTTKEVGEGLGLGLSISYRIVTDLGGTIRAQNLPAGGARLIVRLPLTNQGNGEKR